MLPQWQSLNEGQAIVWGRQQEGANHTTNGETEPWYWIQVFSTMDIVGLWDLNEESVHDHIVECKVELGDHEKEGDKVWALYPVGHEESQSKEAHKGVDNDVDSSARSIDRQVVYLYIKLLV